MSLLNSIKQYEDTLNTDLSCKKPPSGSKATNKKTDMQHASILFTNDLYKKKMFKAQHIPVYETFQSKEDFNSFINDDLDDVRRTNWKQIPLCLKKTICEEYIANDVSVPSIRKQDILLKIDNTFLSNAIKYDPLVGEIIEINYKLIQ